MYIHIESNVKPYFIFLLFYYYFILFILGGHCGRGRMVVGFVTIYENSAYHH